MTDPFFEMDDAIDAKFGEQLTIAPYKSGRYMGGAEPDTSRQPRSLVGYVLVSPTIETAAGGASLRPQADFIASIQVLGDTKQGDRVTLIDRGETCEIAYIDPRRGRYRLHLIRGNAT